MAQVTEVLLRVFLPPSFLALSCMMSTSTAYRFTSVKQQSARLVSAELQAAHLTSADMSAAYSRASTNKNINLQITTMLTERFKCISDWHEYSIDHPSWASLSSDSPRCNTLDDSSDMSAACSVASTDKNTNQQITTMLTERFKCFSDWHDNSIEHPSWASLSSDSPRCNTLDDSADSKHYQPLQKDILDFLIRNGYTGTMPTKFTSARTALGHVANLGKCIDRINASSLHIEQKKDRIARYIISHQNITERANLDHKLELELTDFDIRLYKSYCKFMHDTITCPIQFDVVSYRTHFLHEMTVYRTQFLNNQNQQKIDLTNNLSNFFTGRYMKIITDLSQ